VRWVPPGPALLFCPADRPERYLKAAAAADVVILDLEDGVNASDRPAARQALIDTPLDPWRTMIRVNPAGTPDHALDLAALAQTSYQLLMLAKSESPEQVEALRPRNVVALCETPKGIVAAGAIAAAENTVALMWGAEDLLAALGGRSSRRSDASYRDVARSARSQVLLAAGALERAAVDAVHLDIADLDGLREEAEDAAASGFRATACIHPSQVEVVRACYAPSAADVAWATSVLEAAGSNRGVFSLDGQMVDAPVLRHAEHILSSVRPVQN
jgi:citrate lyase subunit beta / citryl-CoA lyase